MAFSNLYDTKFKSFSFLDEKENEFCYKYMNRMEKNGFHTDWNAFFDQFQMPSKDFYSKFAYSRLIRLAC